MKAGLDRDSCVKWDQVTTLEKNNAVYPPPGRLSDASLRRIELVAKEALELP